MASNLRLTRRGLLRAGVRTGIGLCGASVSALAWGEAEVNWVEVTKLELKLPWLPRAFDGFRIAQISDVHIEGGGMSIRFPDVARLVTAQNADAIVMTGDYTTEADDWQEKPLIAGFQELKAPCGVFAVLGNHDQWETSPGLKPGPEVARSAFLRSGVKELRNDAFAIERNGQRLWMCGVDDWLFGLADVSPIQAIVPQNECAILLAHEPDLADEIAPLRHFDLMLAGHSHGGQVALPFIGPIHVPEGAKKYRRGLYEVGEMALYTNRGLGVVDLPIRFCARPEITVFTLRAGGLA